MPGRGAGSTVERSGGTVPAGDARCPERKQREGPRRAGTPDRTEPHFHGGVRFAGHRLLPFEAARGWGPRPPGCAQVAGRGTGTATRGESGRRERSVRSHGAEVTALLLFLL